MSEAGLNQFLISQVIGGRSAPVARARFSSFSILRTTAQLLRDRPSVDVEWHFGPKDDEVIRRIFERQRKGLSVDRFLADPALAQRFVDACHEADLKARAADINRRLLAMRKASGGGRLDPSARGERQVGLIGRFALGVEYALRRMQIRHGASVDDVIADLEIGSQFTSLARAISPGGTSLQYRLCALQIRKNRHVTAGEHALFETLRAESLRTRWNRISLIDVAAAGNIPSEPGLLELRDPTVSLFVTRADNLKTSSRYLLGQKIVDRIARKDGFWNRRADEISFQFIPRSSLPDGSNVRLWEQRLIRDQHPAFNWWLEAA